MKPVDSTIQWRPLRQLSRTELPPMVQSCMSERSSLTRLLKRACGGRFQVELASQSRGRPAGDEARALDLRPGEYCLIRQVFLRCDGDPWVYGRTVVPLRTLRGRRRRLAHLGNRPLGEVLFSADSMPRGTVEFARIPNDDSLFGLAMRGAAATPPWLWGRRSLFRLHKHPLLVIEIFLPDLCD